LILKKSLEEQNLSSTINKENRHFIIIIYFETDVEEESPLGRPKS
jgi:hypothetical protein